MQTCAKDAHARAHFALVTPRALLIGQALGFPDPAKSAHCTVCHSPQESVPAARLAEGAAMVSGVGCESCHGPAEAWLRFHTRPDVAHAQRVESGMRELGGLASRADACIRCHLLLDPAVLAANHPELFFDFDGQMARLPPHWKDAGAWLGPRAWLVGQAAALRELSWRLRRGPDAAVEARARGLAWLLRLTPAGASALPAVEAKPAEMQAAAARLAQAASKLDWSHSSTARQLRTFTGLAPDFRDGAAEAAVLRRRAEVLVPAIERLWTALKAGGARSPEFDAALGEAGAQAARQAGFVPALFADALAKIEAAPRRE